MSDIPAAVFTLAAVLAMASERPLLAGIAAAAAIVIRPALAPAAVMLAVVEIAVRGWAGARHAALVMAPIGVAAVGQAALQTYLYGSALTSGYGGVGGLFSAERVLSNLRSYGYWAVASLGLPVIALSAVGWAVSDRAARATWVLLSGGLLALYLPYRTYDHWETLRFFLPAVVLMTILAAAGLVAIARRLAGTAGAWLVAPLVAFAMAWSWIGWLDSNNVFTMPEHERRHRFAAEMVEQSTPRDAVIMAVQHSGSVRYYAHRDTLNWERMPPGSIPDTVRALKERGRQVFLMIDSDAERAEFLTRHGDILQRDSWLPAGQRRDVQLYQAPRQERD